jgi:3-oxoacyl-[acyl-carrier protein] reductase
MNTRIILITGANGALGGAIAKSFLEESPTNFIWLGVNRRRECADELAATNTGRSQVIALDVTQPDAWQSAVKEILAAHQHLDVLVNNAGTHDDALLAATCCR